MLKITIKLLLQTTEEAGDQCKKEPKFIDVFAVQYVGPRQPLFSGFASAIARTHGLHRLIKPPKSITAAGPATARRRHTGGS
ncbi:unnamed protein product [Cuscuta campestris]|uniref:Uncharacterized protein n=1 Tax=Cuscuta campestris TaxID=132261 RepID=A0A484L026_9ASTE|nr:unnamed protein product [Cuscuta campestris]